MPDDKLKTSVRLPVELIESVRQLGYTSTTDAIIEGLELLIREKEGKTKEDIGSILEDKAEYTALEHENNVLKEYNETLKSELDKAHKDKENIQNLYDNYMRQMQTLIQQRAIEAPGEKKKPFWKFW